MNIQNLNTNQFDRLNDKYIELCRKHGLNPATLKEIMFYRSKGFNNAEIANRVGVHRVTVQNYVEKLREMEGQDFGKLLFGVLAFIGAAKILSDLFEE